MISHNVNTLANLLTAAAYFWIPAEAFRYLSRSGINLDTIDLRLSKFARLFAAFVLLCGGHHLLMTIVMLHPTPVLLSLLLFMDIMMAAVSVWAAMQARQFFRLVTSIGLTSRTER